VPARRIDAFEASRPGVAASFNARRQACSDSARKTRVRRFIDRDGMRFGAGRMFLELRARADRPMLEIAAAIRTHIAQRAECAHFTESAFVRADHRVGGIRRQ
jgi:hypothetical protein